MTRTHRLKSTPWLAVSAAVVLLLSACGGTGSTPGTVENPRDVAITMTDGLRFDPDRIRVEAGETIRFRVSNPTSIEHELLIADQHGQAERGEEMMDRGAMHGEEMMDGAEMHGADNGVSLAPGESKELTMTFMEPGELLMGCHVDGHYEAGMSGVVTVED